MICGCGERNRYMIMEKSSTQYTSNTNMNDIHYDWGCININTTSEDIYIYHFQ